LPETELNAALANASFWHQADSNTASDFKLTHYPASPRLDFPKGMGYRELITPLAVRPGALQVMKR
jgi:hypothetical protein